MAVYKCKVCAGALNIEENQTIAICEYCGTQQALPRSNNDIIFNLYDRANHFRRNNEFDKAEKIYNQILLEDYADPEVYWSLVLCKYGVEYVEDPETKRRIPTVNRTQFTSIYDDQNYKKALEYADLYQKELFEKEAKTINEIQKRILSMSKNEEPYDVFISYKETDDQGRRTRDAVLANDLYHQLTKEGFKVFFARITLESKLGIEYEPYIFAALNSAKVMVVVGTKPEFFNAVWVKNEWSRFLSLIRDSNGEKLLIPAYRDMDTYDLPEEFSHLQAQDMSKLGFMQDIIHGIKKIIKKENKLETHLATKTNEISDNTSTLLRRGHLYLEEKNWDKAGECFERILDENPENIEANFGKLLSVTKIMKKEDLITLKKPFNDNNLNYSRILRLDPSGLGKELEVIIDEIKEKELGEIYDKAKKTLLNSKSLDDLSNAHQLFQSIPHYKDSNILAEESLMKHNELIYEEACKLSESDKLELLNQSIIYFQRIENYRDSKSKIKEVQKKEEERFKLITTIVIVSISVILGIYIFLIISSL